MLIRLWTAGYVTNQMLHRRVICKDYRPVPRSMHKCAARRFGPLLPPPGGRGPAAQVVDPFTFL
jgi:hypothetical protein